ncbi:MAG: N-acetylmuramoyl-L-alanine amidase [Sumerlaeia bacterium]
MRRFFTLIFSIVFCAGLSVTAQEDPKTPEAAVQALIRETQREYLETSRPYEAPFPARTKVLEVSSDGKRATVVLSQPMSERVWTPEEIGKLEWMLADALEPFFAQRLPVVVEVTFDASRESEKMALRDLALSAENIAKRAQSDSRMKPLEAPLVRRADYPGPAPEQGLLGKSLVAGPSHGITWHKENRWQFQRARLFTTIEDLGPLAYINPFLLPMLENAGANVFSVRERDYNTNEVIVDNDGTSARSDFEATGDWSVAGEGWNGPRAAVIPQGSEPFQEGTSIETSDPKAKATYTPYIPRTARYGVYMSWNADESRGAEVPVTVNHRGGSTSLTVNQQVAGGIWVFLGFFEFEQGTDASVVISHPGGEAVTVSADAVRFGGGMGNVAPEGGQISGQPRYAEAALYYLNYSGLPRNYQSMDFSGQEHFGPDYWRDIVARAQWANELRKLGVPIELYLSFHTDAGINNDGIIGTLSIYRVEGHDGGDTFSDGRSRWLNRDLAASVHQEIQRTINEHYSSDWKMRQLWERNYGEARRPDVPVMLLELLSHQNFHDQQYGLNPEYQKDVARALYKAITRFVAAANGYEPVIQPLAPHAPRSRALDDGRIQVTWHPTEDPLEPTAAPDGYVVYRSLDGVAYDNGTYTTQQYLIVDDVPAGESVYFQITAANAGGESLRSRTVGAMFSDRKGDRPVLIVDGFDRVSVATPVLAQFVRGFDRSQDQGVGDHYNYGLVGEQYDFVTQSEWANDLETPGIGGSGDDMTARLERGNTFDHVVDHGEALAANGVPFDSATRQAYEKHGGFPWQEYATIDWIAGEQRATPPPAGITAPGAPDRMGTRYEVLPSASRKLLTKFLRGGGNLILSGAYIGEDLFDGVAADEASAAFAREQLGLGGYGRDATRINTAVPAEGGAAAFEPIAPFRFGRDLEQPVNMLPTIYEVESPESLEPVEGQLQAALTYADTNRVAAAAGDRVVLFGFPLETVQPVGAQAALLKAALEAVGHGEPAAED